MVSAGHSISFILHPLLEPPIQFRVQPHLRVFLHPASIENTAKVFITLTELWTLLASEDRGKAVRANFVRKSLPLLSDTESQL